ncbi:hypothetical protein [Modestobacter italicus]|uniref:hypothetical protein n=1 Tax=Modestobacter italicus (strain DSM 44449 / CECT 9708 / BC 501) TaxID=2732864 RepID=UPI001C9691EE|nr:hypothetical protein [Modestobacter italicus]
MVDALAGWVGVTVFVLAGLLALGLEARDQVLRAGPARDVVPERRRSPVLGWLLVVLVVAALAAVAVRFAVYLG